MKKILYQIIGTILGGLLLIILVSIPFYDLYKEGFSIYLFLFHLLVVICIFLGTLAMLFVILFSKRTGHLQEEMTIGECNEVFKILNMYRALKTSYNNLQDKSGINPEDIKFKGFDGNFEAKYLCYVQFIFESLNLFEELKDDSKSLNYDTHFETLNRYRKMLKVWENYNKSCTLDKDQIKSIINQ